MNSHILSGAVGAMLALAGSQGFDELKCSHLDAQSIAITDGAARVTLKPAGIMLENTDSGVRCLLTPQGVTITKGDELSTDTGYAFLRYSPEDGAALELCHKTAAARITASCGERSEASLRTSLADNKAVVIAGQDVALLGAVDHGKTSFMNGTICSWGNEPSGTIGKEVGGARSTAGQTVFVTRTGDKYHLAGCQYLRTSMIPMQLSEAIKRFAPCSVCVTQ